MFKNFNFAKISTRLTVAAIPFAFVYCSNNKLTSKQILYLTTEHHHNQDLSNTERIKGEYENRLRIFSPIEKRYTIFGKIKNKSQQMNYYQFFESLIPYQGVQLNPFEKQMEFFSSNKEFQNILTKVDTNEDKSISLEEYLILCFLASSKNYILLILTFYYLLLITYHFTI